MFAVRVTGHLVPARTAFSFCCSQKPACAPVLLYPASTCNRHTGTTWTREHFKVTWKIFFLQLSPGKCKGTDQSGQRHYLVVGLASPRDGVRWPREGSLPLSNEPPLESHSQGSAGRKLWISSVSALEISDPLGTGSCSCGSPEGVPVMKPEGGRLKHGFWEWCNLGQHSIGSDTSDLVTTCGVVTAPLLAWWSQEREERKKEGSGII